LISVSAGRAEPDEPGRGDFETARQRQVHEQSQPEQRRRQRGPGAKVTFRQKDRQTNRQTEGQTNRQAD
jgi:hypothetical protein